MGLFSFLTGSGKKVEKEATKVEEEIKAAGGEVDGLQVSVDGEKVRLRGKARTQAAREKAILAAGNIEGVAEVDDEIEVEAPEPESVFHEVKRGETLSAIAKKHLGDANRYREIFEANRPMLSDPDKIYPGQKLRIPT